jgi:glycosyltransferase involved in cell wall biosynthesis
VSRPTIAAVLPVHDKAPHIRRALESIAGQTRPPDELIIVDDASLDGSMEQVRAFEGLDAQILTRDRPGPGGYAARNVAAAHARSAWVAFLDADDEWLPSHLAEIDRLIAAAGPEVGCVFTGFQVSAGGRRTTVRVGGVGDEPTRLDLDAFLDLWLRDGRCPVCTDVIAVRRELLLEVGGFPDGECRVGGDRDLWLRLLARGPALASALIGAVYHRDSVNMVTRRQPPPAVPCLYRAITALQAGATPATTVRLRRLYNLTAYRHVRSLAGRLPIAPAAYSDFWLGADRLRYLAVRLLALMPLSLMRSMRRLGAGAEPP